jgi:hypothetical protein
MICAKRHKMLSTTPVALMDRCMYLQDIMDSIHLLAVDESIVSKLVGRGTLDSNIAFCLHSWT